MADVPYPGDRAIDVVVRLRHVAGYYSQAAYDGADEIADLRRRLLRINAINDDPVRFHAEIDELSGIALERIAEPQPEQRK